MTLFMIFKHRSMRATRQARLRHSIPSLTLVLIMWAITGYRSLAAYRQLAEEMRSDNPLCPMSGPCLHIQIPLHLALFGHILSLYLLFETVTAILWLKLCFIHEGLMPTAAELGDWYRWVGILTAIASFPVIVGMARYDNPGPQVIGMFAVFLSGLFVACFLLVLHWIYSIVGKEKVEQPQEPRKGRRWSRRQKKKLKQSSADEHENERESGESDTGPGEIEPKSGEPDTGPGESHTNGLGKA